MSIRLRLALWYAALFGVVLALVAAVVFAAVAREEQRAVDRSLVTVTDHYQDEIEVGLAAGEPLARAVPLRTGGERTDLVGTDYTVYGGTEEIEASFTVVDATGRVVLEVPCSGAEPLSAPPSAGGVRPGALATIPTGGERVRRYALPVRANGATVGVVQTAVSLAGLDASLGRTRRQLLAATAGGVLAAALGDWAIAARALRPVAEMTEAARPIAVERSFGRRLGRVRRQDEVGELARTFNQMLASLEAAHLTQRRFVDASAHELRAPLTSITGNLDLLERARDLPSWSANSSSSPAPTVANPSSWTASPSTTSWSRPCAVSAPSPRGSSLASPPSNRRPSPATATASSSSSSSWSRTPSATPRAAATSASAWRGRRPRPSSP